MERLRLRPGLLPDRGVDHEQALVRLDGLRDRLDLLDEVGLEGMAAGGVHDEDVHRLQGLDARLRDTDGVLLLRVAVEARVDLLGKLLELVVGRGAVHVRGDEPDGEALLLEELPQLPRGRRLALPVEADEEHPLLLERDLPRGPEDPDELLVDDPDDVLSRAHPGGRRIVERAALQLLRDQEGELHVDVGLDQRALDVADDLLDQRLVDVARTRDLAKRGPEGVAELLEDHRTPPRNVTA